MVTNNGWVSVNIPYVNKQSVDYYNKVDHSMHWVEIR